MDCYRFWIAIELDSYIDCSSKSHIAIAKRETSNVSHVTYS